MTEDKKQPAEETSKEIETTSTLDTTSVTNETKKKEEDTGYVVVGSGLGIDE